MGKGNDYICFWNVKFQWQNLISSFYMSLLVQMLEKFISACNNTILTQYVHT